jgi:hypothetical protein
VCTGELDVSAGPALFLDGDERLVCWTCGERHAPTLLAMLRDLRVLWDRQQRERNEHADVIGNEAQPPDFSFGGCPTCGGDGSYRNAGREQWFICAEHRVKWLVGDNLFSSWRYESPEDEQAQRTELAGYRVVEPIFFARDAADPLAAALTLAQQLSHQVGKSAELPFN